MVNECAEGSGFEECGEASCHKSYNAYNTLTRRLGSFFISADPIRRTPRATAGKRRLASCQGRLTTRGGANLPGQPSGFFFEPAGAKLRGRATVTQVAPNPRLESAAAFALRDMYQVMHEQFAVTPGVGADDDSGAKPDTSRLLGEDANMAGGLGQLRVLRQRHPIDDQHADP